MPNDFDTIVRDERVLLAEEQCHHYHQVALVLAQTQRRVRDAPRPVRELLRVHKNNSPAEAEDETYIKRALKAGREIRARQVEVLVCTFEALFRGVGDVQFHHFDHTNTSIESDVVLVETTRHSKTERKLVDENNAMRSLGTKVRTWIHAIHSDIQASLLDQLLA